jgi:hypothetical protein
MHDARLSSSCGLIKINPQSNYLRMTINTICLRAAGKMHIKETIFQITTSLQRTRQISYGRT